jgi:hypothetical protein
VAFLIVALWIAGAGAKAVAALCIWRRGLTDRFPGLFALLVVLSVQSGIALALSGNMHRYGAAYALIAWASILFEGFAITSVFWALTEHYPKFRTPGTILLGGLAIIGALVCWVVGYVAPPTGWNGVWHSAIWGQRAASAVMIFVLSGARFLLPKVRTIPISLMTRRAADILTLHVGLTLAASLISIWGAGPALRYNAIVSLITVINGLALGVLCAVFLTRESDVCPEVKPLSIDKTASRATVSISEALCEYARMLDRQQH